MPSERWQEVERIYHSVVSRPDGERAAAVADLCGGDDALRREVESLLEHAGPASAFLETPPLPAAAVTGAGPIVGRRFGAYSVRGLLGAGGMGEVYLARDEQLGRDVAIKVVPRFFESSPEASARFEREARLLAALNHPNIGAIYGLADLDGSRALVLELVDGKTLAEHIATGPLSVASAISVARQIAEALEAAHGASIVHRDLKPANIKITSAGVVKVLDFGLAKLGSREAIEPSSLAHSPITAANHTREGMILGTLGYMSPEQAAGKAADKRSDIWAFGVILFEMLTGRAVFSGSTEADVLAEVMRSEPDWARIPDETPPAILTLLRRCLQKDRNRRLHDIADARVEIEDALQERARPADVAPPPRRRHLAAGVAVGALAGALGLGVLIWATERPETAPLRRLSMPLSTPVAFGRFPGLPLAISPDGNTIVYTGLDPMQLFIRSNDDWSFRALPGTGGALQPFFSPDGQWLAFFSAAGAFQKGATGRLMKLAVAGGKPLPLLEGLKGFGVFGTWVDADTIVIGGEPGYGLQRISSSGGKDPEQLTALNLQREERAHSTPQLLPGTRTLLFGVEHDGFGGGEIEALRLDTLVREPVLRNATQPRYVDNGHLVFVRDTVVMVATFDVKTLKVGEAMPLTDDDIRLDAGEMVPQLAISRGGTLTYVPASAAPRTLVSVTPDGNPTPLAGLQANRVEHPRSSPDGRYVAFEMKDRGYKVYLYDVVRQSFNSTPLTREGREQILAWHPNGHQLAVFANKPGARGIFLKDINGSEPDRLLARAESGTTPRFGSWASDGATYTLAYGVQRGTASDIWIVPDTPASPARPLLNGLEAEQHPMFSPNGKMLAYTSNDSIYVRPYPFGTAMPVSAGSGAGPVWTSNEEIVYPRLQASSGNGTQRILGKVSVALDGGQVRLGEFTTLFPMSLPRSGETGDTYARANYVGNGFDVLPDGRLLMVRVGDTRAREIRVVTNWSQSLFARVPPSP